MRAESYAHLCIKGQVQHDKYRGRHSQPAIEPLSTGSPMGELEKGPKELKGIAQEEKQYESPSTPKLLGTKPSIKEYTWSYPWIQTHWQQMVLLDTKARRGPWSWKDLML